MDQSQAEIEVRRWWPHVLSLTWNWGDLSQEDGRALVYEEIAWCEAHWGASGLIWGNRRFSFAQRLRRPRSFYQIDPSAPWCMAWRFRFQREEDLVFFKLRWG